MASDFPVERVAGLRSRSGGIARGVNAGKTLPKGFALGDDVGSGKPRRGKVCRQRRARAGRRRRAHGLARRGRRAFGLGGLRRRTTRASERVH